MEAVHARNRFSRRSSEWTRLVRPAEGSQGHAERSLDVNERLKRLGGDRGWIHRHDYSSPDGQIVFEWNAGSKLASLEIDLGDKAGYWHVFDLTRRSDSTDEDLNLGDAAGWNRLAEHVAAIREDEASD